MRSPLLRRNRRESPIARRMNPKNARDPVAFRHQRRVFGYARLHWKQFAGSLLLGLVIALLLLPRLLGCARLRNHLASVGWRECAGFTAVLMLVILYTTKDLRDFFKRYWETRGLDNPPFLYFDGLIVMLATAACVAPVS